MIWTRLFLTIILFYSHLVQSSPSICPQLFRSPSQSAYEIMNDPRKELKEKDFASYFTIEPTSKRPRLVITIGIPGSGKSRLTQFASQQWVTINADQLRQEKLIQMKDKGEKININGQWQTPNPNDPLHLFSATIHSWAFKEVRNQLTKNYYSRQNVILDMTSTNLGRVPYMLMARQFGYQIDAVIFKSTNLEWNLKNINYRISQGGLDLAPFNHPNKEQRRREIIQSVYNNFKTFLGSMRLVPTHHPSLVPDLPYRDLSFLKSAEGPIDLWMSRLSNEEAAFTRQLIDHDIFNQIHWISVQATRDSR